MNLFFIDHTLAPVNSSAVGSFLSDPTSLLNPKKLKRITSTQLAKIVQNAALKPTISQAMCGVTPDCCDTDLAITAMMVEPTELPN